jgi:hypothetical protein
MEMYFTPQKKNSKAWLKKRQNKQIVKATYACAIVAL